MKTGRLNETARQREVAVDVLRFLLRERTISFAQRLFEATLATRLHPFLHRIGLMRDDVDVRR
jgi:hypothetical protein